MIANLGRNPMGAASFVMVRPWGLAILTGCLITSNLVVDGMNSLAMTMIAALAIVLVGIPHGTLDVEIAAARFGQSSFIGKTKILTAYIACAAIMAACWYVAPAAALSLFLIISIVHFGLDWRGGADPFLAMMVGWALVALPALTHPSDVANIFSILTGGPVGSTISALLACASVPAALGSLVFAYWAFTNNERQNAIDVVSCIIAALFLPPLIAFAIFFCGLHSPRHMAEALRETKGISAAKKAAIVGAVFMLSMAIGVVIFVGQAEMKVEEGFIRTAFMLISILTMPHFILEHFDPAGLHTDQRQTR